MCTIVDRLSRVCSWPNERACAGGGGGSEGNLQNTRSEEYMCSWGVRSGIHTCRKDADLNCELHCRRCRDAILDEICWGPGGAYHSAEYEERLELLQRGDKCLMEKEPEEAKKHVFPTSTFPVTIEGDDKKSRGVGGSSRILEYNHPIQSGRLHRVAFAYDMEHAGAGWPMEDQPPPQQQQQQQKQPSPSLVDVRIEALKSIYRVTYGKPLDLPLENVLYETVGPEGQKQHVVITRYDFENQRVYFYHGSESHRIKGHPSLLGVNSDIGGFLENFDSKVGHFPLKRKKDDDDVTALGLNE